VELVPEKVSGGDDDEEEEEGDGDDGVGGSGGSVEEEVDDVEVVVGVVADVVGIEVGVCVRVADNKFDEDEEDGVVFADDERGDSEE